MRLINAIDPKLQLDLVRFLARQKLKLWRAGPRMELGMWRMFGSSLGQKKKEEKEGRGENLPPSSEVMRLLLLRRGVGQSQIDF